MFKQATEKADNLLGSGHTYPRAMIINFAEADDEAARQMFRDLYNEAEDLAVRVEKFKNAAEEMRIKYGSGAWKSHFQNTNAISVYLWLKFPDKYYIYKYELAHSAALELGSEHSPKANGTAESMIEGFKLYDEIYQAAGQDEEICSMVRNAAAEESCWNDEHLHTAAIDICFYLSRYYLDEKNTLKSAEQKAANAVSVNNSDVNALADSKTDTVRYWIYAPGRGAVKWEECCEKGIMLLGWEEVGDLSIFASKEEMKKKMKEVYGEENSYKNSVHATWQFANDMKPGDVVFVKKGVYGIIGRGVVESGYEYDAERTDYNNIRHVKWTHKGDWTISHQTPQKTLTDITPYSDFVQQIKDLFDDDVLDADEDEAVVRESYTADDFLAEVFMDREAYDNIAAVLKIKKNIILQGAPGVGKTYAAKRLAYSVMGQKDIDRVMMVQFHQSYSYEDFIMGFRPTEKGFEIRTGPFYNFCKKAEVDSENDYFFIIDEINRGNLSKIFGELFMLIENDKRGTELQLLYKDEKFSVPENVYIIGMMNTADRSLALLDYALRRRFAFIDLKPGFASEGFKAYRESLNNEKFNRLTDCVESLNRAIADDESLGEGFCIGHSYFCNLKPETVNDKILSGIVEYELVPLLKEYWFDEPSNIRDWTDKLRRAVK
ncbi:MAG: AAA family ATPase [Clostridiales bacterium]|nr:AAA family ATPase [Clostridiales bacterium]